MLPAPAATRKRWPGQTPPSNSRTQAKRCLPAKRKRAGMLDGLPHVLTRYEVGRIVGMRALQLAEAEVPRVDVADTRLRVNPIYVAARELHEGVLDALVARGAAGYVPVRACAVPPEVALYLNTQDGGVRPSATLHLPSSSVSTSVCKASYESGSMS